MRALLGDARYRDYMEAVRPIVTGYRDEHGCVNAIQAALRLVEELAAAGKADPVSVNMLLVAGALEATEPAAGRPKP